MPKLNGVIIDDFTLGYLDCSLWSPTGEDDEPLYRNYGIKDISPDSIRIASEVCTLFQEANATLLDEARTLRRFNPREGTVDEYLGHDLWLSRNGHGSGFFARGNEPVWDALQAAARQLGEQYLYVGDDDAL